MKYLRLNENQIKELQDVIHDNESPSREVKRAQAIIMIDKKRNIEDITEMTGLRRAQIFELRKKYFRQGINSIKNKRQKKPKELLTKAQKEEILHILKTKTPNECDSYYNNDYWTTGILGEFIKRTYDVEYKSKTSYYLIFRQAKFTFHKPGRIYHQRDEEGVKEWRKKAKVILERAWKEPNTVILTADEMILSTQTTIQKIWLPQGEYPKIEVLNKRENRSIYGFLNIKTNKEHAFKAKKQNMYITTKILKKIRNIYPCQKLFIFWDNAGWHRGSQVQKFIEKDKNITIVYFPKYAPEENPQEHIWKNGRDKVTHNKFIKDIDKTTNEFVRYLNTSEFNYSFLNIKSDFGM